MRLIQTIVSNHGFRDPESNLGRTALVRRSIDTVRPERPDLVVFPGGYWSVQTEAEVRPVIEEIRRIADEFGIVIAAGIDLATRTVDPKRAGKGGRKQSVWPYYGFVVGNGTSEAGPGGPWQQTSSTNKNADDVPGVNVPGRERVVLLGSKRVGVLICGELFSRRARGSIAGLRPDLVLDLGHESMSTGVTRAMESVARAGVCAVAHTHHVARWGSQSLHFVAATGARESIPLDDCRWVGDDDFWIAWCVRRIGS